MGALTIRQLFVLCQEEMKNGNGNKKVMISDDDEGNGYHELFCGFTPTEEMFEGCCYEILPYGVNTEKAIKDYIILG